MLSTLSFSLYLDSGRCQNVGVLCVVRGLPKNHPQESTNKFQNMNTCNWNQTVLGVEQKSPKVNSLNNTTSGFCLGDIVRHFDEHPPKSAQKPTNPIRETDFDASFARIQFFAGNCSNNNHQQISKGLPNFQI